MTAIHRILKFTESQGISKRSFYANTGLSNGYLDKNSSVGSHILEKISSVYPELSITWIVTGKGEMLDENAKPNAKLNAKPSANAEQNVSPNVSPNVSALTKKASKQGHKPQELTVVADDPLAVYGIKSRAIPILDARAAAGWPYTIDGTGFLDQRPTISLPFGWFQSGEYVLLQIEGDSMHPTIYNGDWAFVRKIDQLSEIKDGYVHVVLTPDGIVCKRVLNRPNKGHLALQSDNSAYPTYTVPYSEILSVWKVEMKMSAILRNENLDIIKRLNTMEADIAEMKVKKKV